MAVDSSVIFGALGSPSLLSSCSIITIALHITINQTHNGMSVCHSTSTSSESTMQVLKIDAEGFECDVIKTMPMILSNGDVEHILFEMIPHVQGMEENMKAMENLLDMGYVIAECPFSFLEGVRDITQPWIKKVVPLEGKDGVKVLLQQMHDVTEKDRLNWKIKHYTDMWATKDKTMFEKFNDAVIPA